MYKRIGDDITLIQMSNYVKPVVEELIGRKWVLNGDKNKFFEFIISRYSGSPTNESVINVYCQLIYGKGIAINGQDEINVAATISKTCLSKPILTFSKIAVIVVVAADSSTVALATDNDNVLLYSQSVKVVVVSLECPLGNFPAGMLFLVPLFVIAMSY